MTVTQKAKTPVAKQPTNDQLVTQYVVQAILVAIIAMGILGLLFYLTLSNIEHTIILSFAGVWILTTAFSMWRRQRYNALVATQALEKKEQKNEENKMRGVVSLVVVLLVAALYFTYIDVIAYFTLRPDVLSTTVYFWGAFSILLLGVGVLINRK